MAKTNNTAIYTPLVITGYVLFTLLIVGVFLSTTLPWGRMLFDSRVMHYNVAIFTVALTIGALLPAFLGYLIGDKAIKSRSRMRHHFNGILFGLLAYWVMTMVSVFVSIPYGQSMITPNVRVIIINLLPSIGVAIVTASLAIAHVRSRQAKQDIHEYKPYGIVLILSVLLMVSLPVINEIVYFNGPSLYTLIVLGVTLALGVVSYVSLWKSKLSSYGKVIWSVISVSIASVAFFVAFQLVPALANYVENRPTMEFQAALMNVCLALALAGWLVYWIIQSRALTKVR